MVFTHKPYSPKKRCAFQGKGRIRHEHNKYVTTMAGFPAIKNEK